MKSCIGITFWLAILVLNVYMGAIMIWGIIASMSSNSQSFFRAVFLDLKMLFSCIGGLLFIGFFTYISIQGYIALKSKMEK